MLEQGSATGTAARHIMHRARFRSWLLTIPDDDLRASYQKWLMPPEQWVEEQTRIMLESAVS
jgi:hypothetical protein